MRKLIIGLISIAFVASLFWGYALIMDAEPIEVRDVSGTDDLKMPGPGDALQQAPDTDVRVAKEARYVVLDPETKEVSRVFGFLKLLNQGMDTSRRQVEKPYMIFHESDYQCRIDADMGMFQVETSGSSSTPKDAQLNGNVKIHVIPRPGSGVSETVIEMDDLVFSSERSEFATDRKVNIKSDRMELQGTGLIVIFDPANGKIDYLRIRDLIQFRMQTESDPQSETKVVTEEPDTASANLKSNQPSDDSLVSSDKVEDTEVKSSSSKYYQCLLKDNVKIRYANEIVVAAADTVKIQNISFDQGVKVDNASERTKDEPKKSDKSKKSEKREQLSVKKAEAESNSESESEIVVTCDGGVILKPMENEDAEEAPVAQSVLLMEVENAPLRNAKIVPDLQQTTTVAAMNLTGVENAATEPVQPADNAALDIVSDPNTSPATIFEARGVNYDLLSGSGLAEGPVRFTFYQDPDPNSTAPKTWIPVIVKADENARFNADSSQTINQVVFNGNVMTTRTVQMPGFVQLDNLHSEKLTVDLDEVQTGTVEISHLSVTEGRVYVESKRTQNDRVLSNVKLYCTKISYDKVDDVILAEGPGKIELVNNEQSPAADSDSTRPMSRPCVAVVDNFTAIRWDMDTQRIFADGQQDAMKLAYYPILDGQIQKQVFVYSMQLEIDYLPGAAGIKKVFTDRSIIYEEWDSDMTKRLHYIVGQTLDYDATDGDGWMKIKGTPAVPCNVDGARMPEVFVHPVSGQIKASISTRPGILRSR